MIGIWKYKSMQKVPGVCLQLTFDHVFVIGVLLGNSGKVMSKCKPSAHWHVCV